MYTCIINCSEIFIEQIFLADRGLDIGDVIAIHGAKLEIPSFTCGKKQLNMEEVEYTKRIVSQHSHRVWLVKEQVHVYHPTSQATCVH